VCGDVAEIVAATSITRPRADVAYCIHSLARRIAKTRNWIVSYQYSLEILCCCPADIHWCCFMNVSGLPLQKLDSCWKLVSFASSFVPCRLH
jgi:hypothetical protein